MLLTSNIFFHPNSIVDQANNADKNQSSNISNPSILMIKHCENAEKGV